MCSFHTPCSCAWYLHWVHITHVVFANTLSMYIVFTWVNIMLQFAPTLFMCRVFAWVHITQSCCSSAHIMSMYMVFTCVHIMLQFAPTLFMCRVFAWVHITHVVVLHTSCPCTWYLHASILCCSLLPPCSYAGYLHGCILHML